MFVSSLFIVASTCPVEWKGFKNSCYLFVTPADSIYSYESEESNWDRARRRCRVKGGDLASLTTDDEANFVYRHTKNLDYQFWIGLRCCRSFTSSYWTWSNEDKLNITNWNMVKPNISRAKQCVVILKKSKFWSNTECDNKHAWICERPKRTKDFREPYEHILATSRVTGMSNFGLQSTWDLLPPSPKKTML